MTAPSFVATVVAFVLRSGTVSFTGHSTLGTFVGTTSVLNGAVTRDTTLESARGWVEAPVATLVTGNDRRDRDLRSTMEVDKYPTMRFDLAHVTVEMLGQTADTVRVQLHGRMTIHGVTRDVTIPARLFVVGDAIDVVGGFPIDLADYQIGGLTRFFGALRMQRNIEVNLRLRFEAPGPAAVEKLAA
jgi:polyisoprenoid-binding protein YceI